MTAKNRMSKAILMIVAFSLCWTMETFARTVQVNSRAGFANAVDTQGQDGDTVSITANISLDDHVTVSKKVTILGNGKTITRTGSRRISFTADASVQNLTFDGDNRSSSMISFVHIAANTKVTMDDKTIIKKSSNGPVLTVAGTLVGGVVTGNTANSMYAVVTVSNGATMINTLVYGNKASGTRTRGNTDNNSYIVKLEGGKLVNVTVAGNTLSGANNNTVSFAYAVKSTNDNSRVINSIIALNRNSTTPSLNLNVTTDLSSSQIITSYTGTADPGFTDASKNDYTLSKESSCIDKGTNSYNTEKYDLAGNDRKSGDAIDQGAYEYQRPCATIIASKNENLIVGEKIVLEVQNVSADYTNTAYGFQWQSSRDGSTWSNIGRNANEARYTIDQVSDSIPYYRVALVSKSGSHDVLCTADAPAFSFADPYVKFVISGYDRVVTGYAYEVTYGRKISFGLEAINHAEVTAFNLSESKLERGKVADRDASEVNDYKYTKTVDDAYEYTLSYTYRIGTKTMKKDTTFIVRPIYTCTGKSNEIIWNDDFGTFNKSGNGQYTYVGEQGTKTITNYPVSNGASKTIKYTNTNGSGYAVPDFRGAVVKHDFMGDNHDYNMNDGYYAIAPTSSDAWYGHAEFGNYPDHTSGDGKGGMLVVNCRENSKDTRIYQRDFSVECDSSLVIFSSFIANVNDRDYPGHNTKNTRYIDANVRLDIYSVDKAGNETLLQSSYSGDLKSREHFDASAGEESYWSNLSAKFLADAGITYRAVLVNNRNGGDGNDMMFDDITISSCCPDMAISDKPSFNKDTKQNVEVCGSDSTHFSIYAVMKDGTVASDYFVSPYYYLYQYREKGTNTWDNLVEGNDPYVSQNKYDIDLTNFPSGSECRVILARSTQRIEQIVRHYNSTLNDASLDEEARYPKVNCAEGVYGVAYGFSISYFPELASLDVEKIQVKCPDESFTFTYDPGEVWKERTWLSADKSVLGTGSSYSTKKSKNEIDTYYFVVAGEGGVCPDTITFEARLNHALALGEMEDIQGYAEANCKSNISLKSYKPDYSYCAGDLKNVDYSYSINGGAWEEYSDASTAELADGDSLTWRAILYVTGDANAIDTAFLALAAHIEDKEIPTIDCTTLSTVVELPAANQYSGAATVEVSASDVRAVSNDNCTAANDLKVKWNSYTSDEMLDFGEATETVSLNAYTHPKSEIKWQVEDEAGNLSIPCTATYEIKKDKYDGPDGPFAVIRDTVVCSGDMPFTWYGHSFAKSGDTAHVGYALVRVRVDSSYFKTYDITACESYTFAGEDYYQSGSYTVKLANNTGCDSIITLNLTINDVYSTEEDATACDSFAWNGVVYKRSGDYTANLTSVKGCDSIATLHLTVGQTFRDTATVAVANSYTWRETGETYTRSGFHKKEWESVNGCDSIYNLNLTIYQPSYGSDPRVLCRKELPYVYKVNIANAMDTVTKHINGDTTITFARENMGDTIITFKMTILEESSSDVTRSVCRADFPYEFNRQNGLVVYNPQSDTAFVIKNSVGCDSTINLHLNILEASPVTIVNETACDSFVYRGETFTEDTTFVLHLENIAGCDSTVNVTLNINHTLNTIDDLGAVCDSVLWHGNWYFETTNVPTFDTVSNVTGCDSIVTLNVVVNHADSTTDNIHLCTSQFVGGVNFDFYNKWGVVLDLPNTIPGTINGTYTTTNKNDCDSIVSWTVYVDASIDIRDTVIAKDSYTWPVDGNKYTASDNSIIAAVNVPSVSGCDSSASLFLRIVPTKYATELDTACSTFSYLYGQVKYTTTVDTTWTFKYEYDSTFTVGGKDVVAYGDSILTVKVKINKPVTVGLPKEVICAPIVWNGLDINSTGTYRYVEPSHVTGCDSTTVQRFELRDSKNDYDTVVVCGNYEWDKTGVEYTAPGNYQTSVQYADGSCDSIVYHLNLTINDPTDNHIYVSLSQSALDTFEIEAHKGFIPEVFIEPDGVGMPNLDLMNNVEQNHFVSYRKNAQGCDSTIYVHVSLLKSSLVTNLTESICAADLPYAWSVGENTFNIYGDTAVMLKNAIGGDSLVKIALTINEATKFTEVINECGLFYTWNGRTYTDSKKDTIVLTNAAGCDSTVYLDLTLNKPTYHVQDIAVCDSALWNGKWYFSSIKASQAAIDSTVEYALGLATEPSSLPYYIEDKKNAAGCDSIEILDLIITKTVVGPVVKDTACDSFLWLVNDEHPDGIYRTSGLYEARTQSIQSNCDSVAYLDLTILATTSYDTTLKVCDNQPIAFEGVSITGDTTFVTKNAAGCDSIINVTVKVFPTYDTTTTIVTCDSVVEWLGDTYKASGIYTKTLKTKACDCDSVVNLNLTINPSPVVALTETACGRYELNGKYYTESGKVTDTFATVNGCDSIVNVDLTVQKAQIVAADTIKLGAGDDCKSIINLDEMKPTVDFCDPNVTIEYAYSNDSINWTAVAPNGTAVVENGDTIYWRADLSDAIGKLDSIVKMQTVSVIDTTAPVFLEDCSAWASIFAVVDSISGDVTFTLSADSIRAKMSDNCTDSTSLDVQWSVNGATFVSMTNDTTITLNAYKGDKVNIGWKVVDAAGNESEVCDKSYEIEKGSEGGDGNTYSIIRDTVVCSNEMPFVWHGATFDEVGDTAHVGQTLLSVNIDSTFLKTETVVACDSFVWRDGLTYKVSNNTAVFNVANAGTCDSVYTLNLTILNSTKLDTVVTVCESQLPIALGGSVISSDSTFTIANAAGCDSVVTVKLNVIPTQRDTASAIACGSYEWNNKTLSVSGQYADTTTSTEGCDVISVLNLTIASPAFDTIVAKNVCHAYELNGKQFTQSGIYNDTLKTIYGCDSIVTLNLTLAPVVYDTVPMRIYCGSLVWNGKEYSETGLYNDTLTSNLYGCDSIVTLVLDNSPRQFNIELTTCEGLPGIYKGIEVKKDTVLTVLDETDGCNIIYNVTLHVTPAFSGDTASVVACETYDWNGLTLTQSGLYTDTLSSINGCDSVAVLQLTIAHPDTIVVNDTVIAGSTYSKYGYTIENISYGVHVYDSTYIAESGCENLIQFTVNATGRAIVIDSLVISGGENGYEGGNNSNNGGNGGNGEGGNGEGGNGGDTSSDGTKIIVNGGLWFCAGDYAMVQVYATGAPSEISLTYDERTSKAGFMPVTESLGADGLVKFFVPDTAEAGNYTAFVQLSGEGMTSQVVKVNFNVSLSGNVIKRKWNDVVVCNNADSLYVAYQWYRNNVKVDGATGQYYNDLEGVVGTYSLDVVTKYGDTLHVCGKDFEQLLPEFSITAYPVPAVANEELTIQVMGLNADQLSHAKLVVYSIDGTIMYKDFDGLFELNTLTLPIGDYVGVVTVDNGLSATCKILVRP